MESQKKGWTNEDKAWAIGGGAVAIAGGIYWYLQNKKASENGAVAGTETTYIDSEQTEVQTESGSSTSGQSSNTTPGPTTPVSTTRQPDAIRYAVGQEVMAIGFSGTKGYETRKMANGQYTTDVPAVLKATFAKGDKIGKIIWVGAYSDGTFRYVVQRDGLVLNQLYWIADYRVIQPINAKATTAPTTTSSLNVSLVLKRGSKGAEVRELQKRLGVTVDGDFGAKTETALLAQKKVSQITLAAFATTNISTLNFNLMLKKGSKGLEVKELQKRLGFTGSNVDGDFGTKTESALFAMKAVKQTTLNQFSYV
jgi:hypothetical protein